jgi:hypothetical protein
VNRNNIYVLLGTASGDFPTTAGAFSAARPPGADYYASVVMKLSLPGNQLVYSTYFWGERMDVGPDGSVYTISATDASSRPTSAHALQKGVIGAQDVYLAKLNPAGTELVYGTYLGAGGDDGIYGEQDIAVDAGGFAYAAFRTLSEDFPTTPGALAEHYHDSPYKRSDIVVAKLARDANSLVYATYLGGTVDDGNPAVAIDDSNHLYITGNHSRECYLIGENAPVDLPTTPRAFDRRTDRHYSAFLSKLSPQGTALVFSTFFGGSMSDGCDISDRCDIALDPQGQAHLAGSIWLYGSCRFPVTQDALFRSYPPAGEGSFLTVFNTRGTDLIYSSLLGGSDWSHRFRIAVDAHGYVYVACTTKAADLPTAGPHARSYHGGEHDIYVAKFFLGAGQDTGR